MKTILIAEDQPAGLELMREMLEARGYKVLEARDGGEALSLLAESTPDLALLDLQMPVKNGYEVLEAIRKDGRLAEMPVFAVTALAMQGDRERVLQAGFDGYITKPVSWPILLLEIERALAR